MKPKPPSTQLVMKGATFMVPLWPWVVGLCLVVVAVVAVCHG